MWPIFVEFRSASSEIRGRNKKEKRIPVKYKSADMYVGRPNKLLDDTDVQRELKCLFTHTSLDTSIFTLFIECEADCL